MSVRGVFATVAIGVVLVFTTSTGTANARHSLPDNVEEALDNDLALLAHVPGDVRPSCLLVDTSFNRDEPGQDFVAALECHPDTATTILYHQYSRAKDLRLDFARAARQTGESTCGARESYTIDHVVQGEWACDRDTEAASVEIAWTFRPLDVLAFLERTDGDVDAARDTWSDQAGPDRAAHRVPAVLSPSAARRGNDELLAQIPNAAEFRCQPVDLSRSDNLLRDGPSPNLWADALVQCRNNAVPGHVTYRRYRDPAAYGSAYDPGRSLRYAEDRDPACGGGYETSWSVDGQDVGRVACDFQGAAPDGEAHIQWTYDPDHIVAEAVVTQQSSAQAQLDWWRDSAGPIG